MSTELIFDRVPPQNLEAEQAVTRCRSAAGGSVDYSDGAAAE